MTTALQTLTNKLAERFEMGDGSGLVETLKSSAFAGATVSDAQMIALLVIANQYQLNPWTKEIYAFP
ncbi:phage recombination protein Bet, partial [Mannheimia haemolytica]